MNQKWRPHHNPKRAFSSYPNPKWEVKARFRTSKSQFQVFNFRQRFNDVIGADHRPLLLSSPFSSLIYICLFICFFSPTAMATISSPLLVFHHRPSDFSSPQSLNLHRPFPVQLKPLPRHSFICNSWVGPKPAGPSTADVNSATPAVTVDAAVSTDSTAFVIRARNKIGLLQVITRVFKVLGLHIDKATVEFEGDFFTQKFFVTDSHGRKIEDQENLDRITKALLEAIDGGGGWGTETSVGPSTRGIVVRRAGLGPKPQAERMFALMDRFLSNDPVSLQKDILDHVEYTVARSRFSFDDFEAYQVILVELYPSI